MATKDSQDTRASQVLLTGPDRDIQEQLKSRVKVFGIDLGPTLVYRAGLRALLESDDPTLERVMHEADDRPSLDQLHATFSAWCIKIADDVAARAPELRSAHDAEGRIGSYSNQGRFVLLSLMQDGRVLVGGLSAVTEPTTSKASDMLSRSLQLFPGGLAVMVSMNDAGAALVTEAIVAWLRHADEARIDEIRAAFRAHVAKMLR